MNKKWTQYEKNVFLTLLQSSGVVNKNKKLNTEIFKWHSIQKKFQEMTGTEISAKELKNKWKEMKVTAICHLQLGNVNSSEYIKVLAICMGIYSEVDDFDMSKIRTELQVEFEPPGLSFEWDENLKNKLIRDVFDCEASSSKKRKMEEKNGSTSDDGEKGAFLKEEFELKKLHLEKELEHQAVRHKMELEILDLKKQIMLKRLDLLNKNKVR